MITLLDYGAGNVRSVVNGIRKLGYEVTTVTSPNDILTADKLIFPGVGNFGQVMNKLDQDGYIDAIKQRISEDKPLLGICIALQTLFEGSEESIGVPGLGVIPGMVKKFDSRILSVPQIGWNGIVPCKTSPIFNDYNNEKLYFVHSYYAEILEENKDWILSTTDYGNKFISSVNKGNITAVQFHPEKSGDAGLSMIQNFLSDSQSISIQNQPSSSIETTQIAKRVIACLDVRANDNGDLVVTKGDQYDVREDGEVRNLGKPVEIAGTYYEEGADEITFLNITGFRDFPMEDQPMLEVLRRTSENVFVPLTIGGGIRAFTDSNGKSYTALDVASEYFRSGADKISIGSDSVYIVESYLQGTHQDNETSIEMISNNYGAQAVVISVDPKRVYVAGPSETDHTTIKTATTGPNGEKYCWYQCTVKGGREGRDIDVIQLATICEKLGAGEILLNCIDKDGTNSGFDIELINHVREVVSIPIIASSGAGNAKHFNEVFAKTNVEAALAAGIFHRREVPIEEVKESLRNNGVEIR